MPRSGEVQLGDAHVRALATSLTRRLAYRRPAGELDQAPYTASRRALAPESSLLTPFDQITLVAYASISVNHDLLNVGGYGWG